MLASSFLQPFLVAFSRPDPSPLPSFSDISPDIRESVVLASPALVRNLPAGPVRDDVVGRLQQSTLDVSDAVRTHACAALVALLETDGDAVPQAMREALFRRRLDKNVC